MPVGCFPSFRKSLKKFSKGRAPLPKKENNNANVDGSNVKPEVNNYVDVIALTPPKVEEPHHEETVAAQLEVEAVKQHQGEASPKTEKTPQDEQPASCPTNCGRVCHAVQNDEVSHSVPCKPSFHEERNGGVCLSAPSEVDTSEAETPVSDEAADSGDGGVQPLTVEEPINSHDSGNVCKVSVCHENVQQPSEPEVHLGLEPPYSGADVEECTTAQMGDYQQAPTEPEANMNEEHDGVQESAPKQEAEVVPECISIEPAEANEGGPAVQEMKKVCEQPAETKDEVLPRGFSWRTISYPLPAGAIDIHELHFPIHIGLIETSQGEFPCKFLERNKSFYAGIDGLEEDFAWGKILCLDPAEAGSIELEWVHVSDPELRNKNLIVGARDRDGKPMYIARGMVPPSGRFPNYELSSGWVSEELQEARLAFLGVEWRQSNFDVLTWKPSCH